MAKHDILEGPSKFDLMVSHFEGESGSPHRKYVRFVIRKPADWNNDSPVLLAVVDSSEREDGSGECWNLKGYVWLKGEKQSSRRYTAWYSTARRKGFIELL